MNVNASNSQLDKLKSEIKNETSVNLRLSLNIIGESNYETNFPHKLILTDRQVPKPQKAFANNSSVDIQSGGFLGRLLGPLLKTGLPLTKNYT